MIDNKTLTKYLYAFTYGDGGVYYHTQNHKNAQFISNQSAENEDYIYWRGSILENITALKYYPYKDKRTHRQMIRTVTMTHPKYTILRERIYHQNRKVLDPHGLKLFDWETLAIFYQDDGSLTFSSNKYRYPIVRLATQNFTYGENVLLQQVIKEKLNIWFNINRQPNKTQTYYYLQLRAADVNIFVENISSFIVPSFYRKINLSNENYLHIM